MYKKRTIATILLISPIMQLSAAEWVFDVEANPEFGYDDNIFLQEDERGSFNFSIKPTVELSRNVENMETTISTGYKIDRFFSESSLNSTNYFIDFSSAHQLERMNWAITAAYNEDSTRNEALEDDGDFSSTDDLRRRSISPSLSYQLSERDTLNVGIDYSETEYSSNQASDNKTKSISLGWQRSLTERLSVGISTTVSNYKLDGPLSSSDDDNYNISLTSDYQLSDLWIINGSFGYRRLYSEVEDLVGNRTDRTSSGSSYQVGSEYSDGRNDYSIELSKQLSPSSSGDVNEQERVSGIWSRQLGERLRSRVSLSYQETESASTNNRSKRKNLDFSPSLAWQLSAKMSVDFKYVYRQQKENGMSRTDVDSNSFIVNINYDWDGIRFSR